jgi:hypothetical protein
LSDSPCSADLAFAARIRAGGSSTVVRIKAYKHIPGSSSSGPTIPERHVRIHARVCLWKTAGRYNSGMGVTLEDGLRALRESTELARSIRIELDADYLRAIALVEASPANQSGSDKTWVWRPRTRSGGITSASSGPQTSLPWIRSFHSLHA